MPSARGCNPGLLRQLDSKSYISLCHDSGQGRSLLAQYVNRKLE
jgi:hypothetical protein